MRFTSTAILAGVATVALASAVAAQGLPAHSMRLVLPDGSTEVIHYVGAAAPQVEIFPAPGSLVADSAPMWVGTPMAEMMRVAAAMDRQADALLRQTLAMADQPWTKGVPPIAVDAQTLPPGTRSYSYIATFSNNGICGRGTEVVANGPGRAPRVMTHSFGNCAAGPAGFGAPPQPAQVYSPRPRPPAAPARRVEASLSTVPTFEVASHIAR